MAYLDALPEGLQNVYGGSQQLYRKPQYTQIGQTRVTSPTRLPLGGSMYGSQALEMPTIGGQQAPLAPTPSQGIPETGVQTDAEDYLKESGDWELHVGSEGQETWLPKNAEEGQWYEDESGQVWFRQGGEWVKQTETTLNYDDLSIQLSWTGKKIASNISWINSANQPGVNEDLRWMATFYLGGRTIEQMQALIDSGHMPDNQNTAKMMDFFRQHEAKVGEMVSWASMLGIDVDVEKLKRDSQYATDIQNQISQGFEENREGENVNITNFKAVQDNMITDWQDNITEFMDSMEAGEFTYDASQGGFVDADGNAVTGWVTDWMSEVIGKSYETGGISGELFTIDEDGNIVLAEELQTMSDWFDANDDVKQDYMEYNRQLAAHAISSGKSLNSGYYSEAAANVVSTYAAQQTDQIAKVMMEDISSQFTYIANSIANMMKDIWSDNDRNTFLDKIETQKEAIMQEYEQWAQQMAANVAETEAAKRGEIITSIFTFIINMGLAFL